MAVRDRKYNEYVPFDRPKIPRNQYGLIDYNALTNSSSLYSGASSGAGSESGSNVANIVNLEMSDLADFKGATNVQDGERGLVPAPLVAQRNWFLKGGGERGTDKWTRIPAADWLYEWPASEGLEKRGLGIEGDFHVGKTLSTFNLNVEGAAHFWTLIVDEIKANGGSVIISPSTFVVDYVGEIVPYYIFNANAEENKLIQLLHSRTDVYNLLVANNVEYVRCRRLWQKCDDGEKRIENKCYIGDMLRCRSFNLKEENNVDANGVYHDVSNTDYWSFVVAGGEGTYTDADGNTYDGIYIDLAFALTTADKNIIPLGSTLYEDHVEMPDGFDAYESDLLIELTADVYNGNRRDIELQVFEHSEWASIQEHVINIRGYNEQIEDITGEANTRKLKTNEVSTSESHLDTIVNGNPTLFTSGRSVDIASLIVDNTLAGDSSTDSEDSQGSELTRQILGQGNPKVSLRDGLSLNRVIKSEIVLPKETTTQRTFVAADTLYDSNNNVVYEPGDVIQSGTTTLDNWRVVDNENVDTAYTKIDNVETPVSESDKEQIDNLTNTTQSAMNRTVDYRFDTNYNEITSWRFGFVSDWRKFSIKKDDNLVCLGHLYDESRQNAIVLSADGCELEPGIGIDSELQAPYISQYSRIDTFGVSISKYRQTAIAANGNEFIGSFFVNYNGRFLDINERINMFITDISTGLESVGIHLDGDKSQIRLVGSVDLRQHSNDDYDTLNVYDSLNQKRVEITPQRIPARDVINNKIISNKFIFNTIADKKNIPTQYITLTEEKKRQSLFNYYWNYTYKLDGFNLNYKLSTDLGYLNKDDELSLSDLFINIKCPTYLNGNEYITLHSDINFSTNPSIDTLFVQKQFIKSLTYTLKINGVDANGVAFNGVPVVNVAIPFTANGLLTDNITVTSTSNLLNTTIPISANYTLDIDIQYNVFAMIQIGNKYNDYYMSVDSSVSGQVRGNITKAVKVDGQEIAGGKMTIGTNGFNFYTNALKFFYAGEDGYELRWGDDSSYGSITLDNTYGLRIIKPILNVNTTTTVGLKHELIVCNGTSANPYTVTLPLATDYGLGREMTVYGFIGLTLHFQDSIIATFPVTINEITFGLENCPQMVINMIATNIGWIITSYN